MDFVRRGGVLLSLLVTSPAIAEELRHDPLAIQKIELLGGKVIRDPSQPGSPVLGINLEGSKRFHDGYAHLLRPFPHMVTLVLAETRITDATLKELRDSKTLTLLDLRNCGGVTDVGIHEIGGLENLTRLDLSGTRLTDAGLRDLARLESLTTLALRGTLVSDIGMKEIGGFENLTSLTLGGVVISDAGIREFRELRKLKLLRIGPPTDMDIVGNRIMKIRNRRPGEISDVGLRELKRLRNLTTITLDGDVKITDPELWGLKQALPNLEVTR